MADQMQQFSSAPQAVRSRPKYRDDDTMANTGKNIMHDKRVVRGNTYASLVMPQQDNMAEVQKQREAQRRRLMRANQTKRRPGTPEAVIGRKHMDIQTDSYLEELTERTVEFEAETQTDFLLDRPPSPLFMPAKVGVDIETQIEEGELFDFDREVEPVLEVLVGKTLEQSMMEVLEEEELDSIRRHQEEFEQLRNAELLEVQRMEAAEKRRADELERRMQQQRAQKEQDMSVMRKVMGRNMAFDYLGGLKERAMKQLLDAGVFQDTIQVAVDGIFLPNLMSAVTAELHASRRNQTLVKDFSKMAVDTRMNKHHEVLDKERARIQAFEDAERKVRQEREEAKRIAAEEAERIKAEQAAMEAWENRVPTPDPGIQILEPSEDGNSVKLADGTECKVQDDLMEKLRNDFDLLDKDAKMLMGMKIIGEGEDRIITEIQVADKAPVEGDAVEPDADAAAAGGGDD
jgi:hypothetical protein